MLGANSWRMEEEEEEAGCGLEDVEGKGVNARSGKYSKG